jgi:hypothetical protein
MHRYKVIIMDHICIKQCGADHHRPPGTKVANLLVDCVWNVIAQAQKPDFVFWRKGQVHLNRRGVSFRSTTGSRGVSISGSNAGYTTFWDSVNSTGYPLHSPVSPSLPPVHHCVPSRFNWTLLYLAAYIAMSWGDFHVWSSSVDKTTKLCGNLTECGLFFWVIFT